MPQTIYCDCEQFKKAQISGTDNEGYGVLVYPGPFGKKREYWE